MLVEPLLALHVLLYVWLLRLQSNQDGPFRCKKQCLLNSYGQLPLHSHAVRSKKYWCFFIFHNMLHDYLKDYIDDIVIKFKEDHHLTNDLRKSSPGAGTITCG